MTDPELFTPTEGEPPTIRSRRSKAIAVSIALTGVLLVGGTGTAFAIQAGHTAIDNLSTGESPEYVPLAERDDAEAGQLINPTPTTTSVDGIRRNEYGTPLYDVNSDPSLVTLPDSNGEKTWPHPQLTIDQWFIAAKCMADGGFDFSFTFQWERTPADLERGDVNDGPRMGEPEYDALWGNPGFAEDYRWEDAGCLGYAVHLTGMDGQN